MSLFPADIEGLARQIIADFAADGLMVSTAESCTGGLIAGALTEISGSSAVVDRGFVTYTNEAKMDMLGVGAETLTGFGAVSRQTALQMAHGALFRSRADFAVAVTGIAGPGGGTPEKPVGLVFIGIASRKAPTHVQRFEFGDIGREGVRLATVREALTLLERASE